MIFYYVNIDFALTGLSYIPAASMDESNMMIRPCIPNSVVRFKKSFVYTKSKGVATI